MIKGGNINKSLILYAMTGRVEDMKRVIQKGAKVNITGLTHNPNLKPLAFHFLQTVNRALAVGQSACCADDQISKGRAANAVR